MTSPVIFSPTDPQAHLEATHGPEYVFETTSLWRDAARAFAANRLALAAVAILSLVGLSAVVAAFWTPYPPYVQALGAPYAGPSGAHPLGLDGSGRDILSALMSGASTTMAVGVGTVAIVLPIGLLAGLAAGYFRGVTDAGVSFVVSVWYGVPDLLVALVLITVIGPGLPQIIFAIAVTRWMDITRLVRGQTLALRERNFVDAARCSGTGPWRIMARHVLPNAMGPIVVQVTYLIPQAILFEAFLSYLGLGVQPPSFSWGAMANQGFRALEIAPHVVAAPVIALSLTLMALNWIGDGLRDALDPQLQ